MNEDMLVKVKADISDYEQAMDKVATEPAKAVNRARSGFNAMNRYLEQTTKKAEILSKIKISPMARIIDRTTSTLKKIESNLNRINPVKKITITAIDRTSNVVKGIANKLTSPLALLGAGAGGAATIAFPLKLAGEMEQARIAMDFFTESTVKGQKFLKELTAFAAKTPFEFPFLQETAIGLMGTYKGMMDVDKSMKMTMRTIKAFGDAAGYTGAGEYGMELALLGFKQIGMVGTLQMEELRQVTENLRIPMSLVQKELGLTSDQMSELGKQGIPASRAMEAILKALEKNFGGGMEKMSKSLIGLTSTVKDTTRFTVTAFGEGMAGPIKRILTDIVGSTDYTSDKFQAFLKKVEGAGKGVGEFFERSYNKTKKFFDSLSNDPYFKKLDWGDKVVYLLDKAMDKLYKWMDGPGGQKAEKIFEKLAEIASRAWLKAVTSTMKGSVNALLEGNPISAIGLLAVSSMLGGGLLVKGGKGLFKAGRSVLAGVDKLYSTKTAARIAALESSNPLAASIVQATYGGSKANISNAAKGATVARAITPAAESISTKTIAETGAGLSKLNKALPTLGKAVSKAALPLTVATEAYGVYKAKDKVTATAGSIGGLGGSLAGAKLGAMLGTAIMPGIGTVIGGALGGIGGYFGGRLIGEKAVELAKGPSTATKSSTEMNGYLNREVYEPFRNTVNRAESWGRNLIINFTRGRDSAGMSMGGWLNSQVYLPFRSIVVRAESWGRNMMLNFVSGMQQVKVPPVQANGVAQPTKKIEKHAYGGILNRPHLGLVAEEGPEAIIPLSPKQRQRALSLWQEAGRYLGVIPYAIGGIAGPAPVLAGASGGGIMVNAQVSISNYNEIDDDALALSIGRKIVSEIKKAYENRA